MSQDDGNSPAGVKHASVINIPLKSGNTTSGFLRLKDRRENHFSKTDMELFESIARPLGISLSNQRAQAALRERVKELTCMYGISQAACSGASIDEIMQCTVEMLPPAWQYPKITHGKIILDGRVYETTGEKKGPHRLSADIIVEGITRGEIEVVYTQEAFAIDEGPFLSEERNLIDNIAKELALVIEQKETEVEKARLKEQILHADRLATIGQLAAGVAHELNEPLGAILGFAQLMGKRSGIPKQTREDLDRIINASLHAREIVKKLLFFSRQVPTKKNRIDINQIVDDGLYFLESRCAKEGIRVIRLPGKDIPDIIADPAQITQVLVNLVVNAIQAMKDGGTLTVQTTSRDNQAFLIVKDTGEGMSEAVTKQIFLPFFTTKEVGQGTGLGLAVVHGIVTSHGGLIHVESIPGHGSCFEIQLPGVKPVAQGAP